MPHNVSYHEDGIIYPIPGMVIIYPPPGMVIIYPLPGPSGEDDPLHWKVTPPRYGDPCFPSLILEACFMQV